MRLRLLLGLLAFNALTATLGAVSLIAGINNPPQSWLAATPFSSYVVPGLILGVVVGGSSLLALIAFVRREGFAPTAAFIAGLILIGWILGEVLFIKQLSWLQGLYCAIGVLLVSLTYTPSKLYIIKHV